MRENTKILDASIIIPTIEIDSLTKKCVQECLDHFPGVNIFVIIDFENNNTFFEKNVIILTSGECTIAKKRNIAAQSSVSEYLAFIDSDAFPHPHWLKNAVAVLQSQKNTWAVGGPNISPPKESLSERFVGLSQKSILVAGFNNFRKQFKPPRFCNDLPSCNLIVRRQQFLEMGGMREELTTGEDIEFCYRLKKLGKQIYYKPDIIIFHKNRSLKNYLLQRITYGASVFELIKLTKSKKTYLLFIPLIAFLFFCSAFIIPWVPPWKHVYFPVLAIYFSMVSIESIRFSENISDLPGVFLALVIGNLAPALGTLAKGINVLPDRKKIYKNT